MANDLEAEIVRAIQADGDDTPSVLQSLTETGLVTVVAYIVDKMEGTGIDPRAEYADMTDAEVDYDIGDDDDFDDDEDDDEDDDDVTPV